MFIVQGVKKHFLKRVCPLILSCPNCGKQGATVIRISASYYHVFWIPFISLGRTGDSFCKNCKKAYKSNKMKGSLKLEYQNLRSKTQIPFWNFSGLGALVIVIFIISLYAEYLESKDLDYATNPQVGDMYQINERAGAIGSFRIDSVSIDSIWVRNNSFSIFDRKNAWRLRADSNFTDSMYSMPVKGLKQMLNKRIVHSINRD